MKLFVVFVVITLFAKDSLSESYIPNARHPDVPGKCYLADTGEFIEFDEFSTPIGICNRFTCRDDYVIRVDHCSRYLQPENCEIIPRDLTQTYPGCCPKLKCVDRDGNVEIRNTGV